MWASQVVHAVKNLPTMWETQELKLGRSPAAGSGNSLQYACLENSVDREAWQAIVHGVAKSQILLSD